MTERKLGNDSRAKQKIHLIKTSKLTKIDFSNESLMSFMVKRMLEKIIYCNTLCSSQAEKEEKVTR